MNRLLASVEGNRVLVCLFRTSCVALFAFLLTCHPDQPERQAIHIPAADQQATQRLQPAEEAFTDLSGDGMPDFVRLDSEADHRAFRQWFTFLAEAQYYRRREDLPREINDCAALIRFAYREALRAHDGAWAAELRLEAVPPLPSIGKYRYPHTPLGANLFRIEPGRFRAADLETGAFAQFADAKTLRLLNTHRLTRDVHRAAPGDLLFWEQMDQEMPFHAMIYLGASHVESPPGDWVVYHTGPSGDDPGEIRRPSLEELLEHPKPQWRPAPGNSNFLGVYRWNILRGAS